MRPHHPLSPVVGVPSHHIPSGCGQVGQYISRAEELKVLVTSSSKNLLQQGNPAREILKGFLGTPTPYFGVSGVGRGHPGGVSG